jgi:hypothetical protein
MSNDTAAFFASKKKKKGFKFNANLVDADALVSRDHVYVFATLRYSIFVDSNLSLTSYELCFCCSDAPALSTDGALGADATSSEVNSAHHDEWDDAALASDLTRRVHASSLTSNNNPVEAVRDMKSDGAKGHSGNDIAEKLRTEEIKAQLAAAREGMEREAKLLKEKKEEAEAKKSETAPRFAGAGSSTGRSGDKWMPPSLSKMKMGAASTSTANRRFNVEDEELFPELAVADKIIEQKERDQQHSYKPVKKTPVGGGATWGSKPKITASSPAVAPEPEATQGSINEEPLVNAPAATATSSSSAITTSALDPVVPTSEGASANVSKVAPVKKKKKDLSTFKPTGTS